MGVTTALAASRFPVAGVVVVGHFLCALVVRAVCCDESPEVEVPLTSRTSGG